MSIPQLVSHHLCPYVQRAVITLTEKAIEHQRIYIDLADKPAWFQSLSPLGRVPVLRTGDTALFESAVICEYLDETTPGSLHPDEPVERAVHRAWIEFASATLDTIARLYNAPNRESFSRHAETLRGRFARLEDALDAHGPYFAGAGFHMVDAAWAPVFRYLDAFEATGLQLLEGLERVPAYRRALAARPSVRDAVPGDYPERLLQFLIGRGGYLAELVCEVA